MALNLAEIQATLQPGLEAAFVKTVVEDSPLMSLMTIEVEPRGARSYVREGVLPEGAFRQFNAAYSEKKAVYAEDTVTLKPFGGQVTIDRKIAQMDSKFGMNQGAQQIEAHFRGLAADLKKAVVKSTDQNSNGFLGLETLTAIGPASQNILYDNQANGAALSTAALLVANMDNLINAVGNPSVMVASRNMLAKINALALSAATNNVLAQLFRWVQWTNPNGMTWNIGEYRGIPFIPVGFDSQRADILPFTESQGNTTDNSSIYALRFGTQGVKMLVDKPTPDVFEIDTASGRTFQPDWLTALFVQDPYSIARLRGIRA